MVISLPYKMRFVANYRLDIRHVQSPKIVLSRSELPVRDGGSDIPSPAGGAGAPGASAHATARFEEIRQMPKRHFLALARGDRSA